MSKEIALEDNRYIEKTMLGQNEARELLLILVTKKGKRDTVEKKMAKIGYGLEQDHSKAEGPAFYVGDGADFYNVMYALVESGVVSGAELRDIQSTLFPGTQLVSPSAGTAPSR